MSILDRATLADWVGRDLEALGDETPELLREKKLKVSQ